jgi:hypothetical protein
MGLVRGYMFANKTETIKEKAINYNFAIQTNNTESLWNFIQSGGKSS